MAATIMHLPVTEEGKSHGPRLRGYTVPSWDSNPLYDSRAQALNQFTDGLSQPVLLSAVGYLT